MLLLSSFVLNDVFYRFDASNDLLAGIENSIQDVNLMQKNIDMAKLQTGLYAIHFNYTLYSSS